jgi:hypothetical protein
MMECVVVGRITVAQRRTGRTQQSYQLVGRAFDRVVHHGDVELRLGGQFLAGVFEAPGNRGGIVGASADQAPLQLVPARRGKEHQSGRRHRITDLAGTL